MIKETHEKAVRLTDNPEGIQDTSNSRRYLYSKMLRV